MKKDKMKILILGAKGMLGTDLMEVFKEHEIIGLDKDELDLTNFELTKKEIQKLKPEIIINAAAYTAVDDAEENRDLAMMINGENNIFGIQSFAVVKFNAPAKLENPFCCIGCGIPAFCQFRNRFSIGVYFNQAIPKLPT